MEESKSKPIIGVTTAWSIETWGDSLEGGYYYVGKPYVEAQQNVVEYRYW